MCIYIYIYTYVYIYIFSYTSLSLSGLFSVFRLSLSLYICLSFSLYISLCLSLCLSLSSHLYLSPSLCVYTYNISVSLYIYVDLSLSSLLYTRVAQIADCLPSPTLSLLAGRALGQWGHPHRLGMEPEAMPLRGRRSTSFSLCSFRPLFEVAMRRLFEVAAGQPSSCLSGNLLFQSLAELGEDDEGFGVHGPWNDVFHGRLGDWDNQPRTRKWIGPKLRAQELRQGQESKSQPKYEPHPPNPLSVQNVRNAGLLSSKAFKQKARKSLNIVNPLSWRRIMTLVNVGGWARGSQFVVTVNLLAIFEVFRWLCVQPFFGPGTPIVEQGLRATGGSLSTQSNSGNVGGREPRNARRVPRLVAQQKRRDPLLNFVGGGGLWWQQWSFSTSWAPKLFHELLCCLQFKMYIMFCIICGLYYVAFKLAENHSPPVALSPHWNLRNFWWVEDTSQRMQQLHAFSASRTQSDLPSDFDVSGEERRSPLGVRCLLQAFQICNLVGESLLKVSSTSTLICSTKPEGIRYQDSWEEYVGVMDSGSNLHDCIHQSLVYVMSETWL